LRSIRVAARGKTNGNGSSMVSASCGTLLRKKKCEKLKKDRKNMADYSGDLKYRITVDGAEASQAKLSKLGASFKSVASSVALSVAAMVSFRKAIEFAGDAWANYENAIQATRQINAALESTGRAAEFTAEELGDMASGLQALSNYGDEDILQGVTLQLLRFDAIGRDIFPRAQKLVIDLAESMGGVENSARTLGISLADPTLGLTRLRRIGVAFNSTQEEQIKNFVETGKTAEAQAVLMSALEDRFGGLALASVSATTQMKNAWGDYLEGVGNSLVFFDGIKRGITAMLVSVAGAHDVTSKSAQLAALETQKAWGEATINISNIVADISTEVVAVIDGVIKAFDFAGKAIPTAIRLAMDGSYLIVASAMNSIVDLIVSPIEGLFNDIDAVYAKISGKSLGITNAFDAVRIDVTGVSADISSSADDISVLWEDVEEFYRTWGDVASGIATGKFSNVDEQIKLLREGIDAQRSAIEKGLLNVDLSGLKETKDSKDSPGGMGGDIAKAETAELAAEKERQLSIVESFVNSVINLNASEADAITKKYADMRTTAAAYYADGLMSEHAFSEAIAQINQAELDAIANLEAKRLDLRIQTLGSIRGFEDEFYYARITQIDAETDKLREAGLAEIEIHAWVQEQKLALEAEIDQRRIDQMSEYERYVLGSNKQIMDTLEGSLANSLASMISGTKSALDVWKSLWANIAQSIIAEISKIIVKALFANTLLKGLGIATGNIGAFFGIGTGAMTQSQGFIGPVNQAGSDPFAILSAIDNNANQTTSAIIRQERDNNALYSLSERIDKLATAIENNKPQIYTQVIEGVPFNNAIRRAAAVANEL